MSSLAHIISLTGKGLDQTQSLGSYTSRASIKHVNGMDYNAGWNGRWNCQKKIFSLTLLSSLVSICSVLAIEALSIMFCPHFISYHFWLAVRSFWSIKQQKETLKSFNMLTTISSAEEANDAFQRITHTYGWQIQLNDFSKLKKRVCLQEKTILAFLKLYVTFNVLYVICLFTSNFWVK